MNTLTIVVIIILALFTLIGWKKGAIKMLLSIFSLLITVAIATAISPKISEELQKTNLYDSVYDQTYEYVNTKIIENSAITLDSAMEGLELPESIREMIRIDGLIENGQEGISKTIASKLTSCIFDVIVFIVTFIAATIIMKLIIVALNIVSYLPVIHGINNMIGIVIGFIEGLIVVWLFFVVITLAGNSSFSYDMFQQINSSPLLMMLYNNNVIMNMLFK